MRNLLKKYSNEATYMFVLLCIFAIYCIDNTTQGVEYFKDQVPQSSIFICFLWFCYTKTNRLYLLAIMAIESLSTIINLIACYQYGMAHKTAFIYMAYGDIMTGMLVVELAIIGSSVIRDGYSKRHYILRLFANNSRTLNSSIICPREMSSCTIP